MDRAVVEDQNEGPGREPELGTIAPIDLLQESDKVRASFGPAGVYDQIATRPVEHPEHCHFRPLARCRNAPIGPFLRPDMRQVRMSERFGFVREQKHDIARLGLSLEQPPAQARPVHRVRVLATSQRMAGPSPAEIPFWRSTTDSREREMRTPERFSIASARRGSVQFGRSATGPDRTSSATASAHSALTGAGPSATDFFNASIPPVILDPTRDKGATPEPNRVLADPESFGNLTAGPARQSEPDRPRPVRFAPIPRTAERHQGTSLFVSCRNRC